MFNLTVADTSNMMHGSPGRDLNDDDLSGVSPSHVSPSHREEDSEEESNSPRKGEPDLQGKLIELIRGLQEEIQDLRGEVAALRRREAPDGLESLLPREEAAEALGISVRTLDDMEEVGEIQAVRIRGRVLYAPETLQAYIRRRAGGDRS